MGEGCACSVRFFAGSFELDLTGAFRLGLLDKFIDSSRSFLYGLDVKMAHLPFLPPRLFCVDTGAFGRGEMSKGVVRVGVGLGVRFRFLITGSGTSFEAHGRVGDVRLGPETRSSTSWKVELTLSYMGGSPS